MSKTTNPTSGQFLATRVPYDGDISLAIVNMNLAIQSLQQQLAALQDLVVYTKRVTTNYGTSAPVTLKFGTYTTTAPAATGFITAYAQDGTLTKFLVAQ